MENSGKFNTPQVDGNKMSIKLTVVFMRSGQPSLQVLRRGMVAKLAKKPKKYLCLTCSELSQKKRAIDHNSKM